MTCRTCLHHKLFNWKQALKDEPYFIRIYILNYIIYKSQQVRFLANFRNRGIEEAKMTKKHMLDCVWYNTKFNSMPPYSAKK